MTTTTDEHGSADDDYSATVLASHWIQRPEQDTKILTIPPDRSSSRPGTPPDRAEGTVYRFGPGVTAAVAHRTRTASPAPPTGPRSPRRRLRRHALPALVLAAVLAFLAWQHLGPSVGVRDVAVGVLRPARGCDATADIVGVVTTDGRPGRLSYRWIRSDGTTSGVLHEVLSRGQKQARLHLLWTFQGQGHYDARAELRLIAPAHRAAATRLTYDCRGR
jgi:hypothetical protein